MQLLIDHITGWLKDYLEKSGARGFVVGVSGGIDSAVTSRLAALTGAPVLCLEMPIYQSHDQVNRASKHIRQLRELHENVNSQTLDLSGVFDSFMAQLPDYDDFDKHQHSLVNARARLRMTTLYYFAGLHNYLVAGTGNKVEDFGVGFYTKYGDGGVDLSPIADLVKSEVYAIGKHLQIIPEILNAPPTDGLWGDDRTDEDQLGASYPELEWAMHVYDQGKSATDFSGREREVLEIFVKLHHANRHKMDPIPVCIIPPELRK
jgi:NAD+ synthase